MSEAVVKPSHVVKCQYEWKIEDVIKKLDAAAVGEYVFSNVIGSETLQWKIGLKKAECKPAKTVALPGSQLANSEDKYAVGVFLNLVAVNSATGKVPAVVDASFEVAYLDYAAVGTQGAPVYVQLIKSAKSEVIEISKNWGWAQVMTRSALRDEYTSSSGTLGLRATLKVRNTPELAYELASRAHELRTQNLIHSKLDATGGHQLITIEVSDVTNDDEHCLTGPPPKKHRQSNESPCRSLKIWKNMLVNASSVFNAMLVVHADTSEGSSGVVVVKDCSFTAMQQFVDYIERGPSTISHSSELAQLAKLADRYDVADLYGLCVVCMLKSIKFENVLRYYAVGHLLEIDQLKKACIRAIREESWGAEACKGAFWTEALNSCDPSSIAELFGDLLATVRAEPKKPADP